MNPSQASSTARVIAAGTILLASDTRTASQVSDGAAVLCKQLLSSCRFDRWLAQSAAHPFTRALWRLMERLTLPGIVPHYWHRKRWIEQRCRDSIAAGFQRVVVLGAGLDTLAARLAPEWPNIDFIEIDHPATMDVKRRTLAGDQPTNLLFIALDLNQAPLPIGLLTESTATLFIVEGLLMYLSPAAVAKLFADLRALPVPQLQLVFSFMTKWPDGRSGFRPHSWLVERWLAWRKEPFTWSLEPERLQDFLQAHHFKLLETASTPQLRGPASSGTSLDGENLVVCERS